MEGRVEPGAYLTDGTRLLRVTDAFGDSLFLEDCRYPDELPAPWSAHELAGLEVVRRVSADLAV